MKQLEEIRAGRDLERDLAAALRLQRLLAMVSSCFATHEPGHPDTAIEDNQRLVCETLGIDRSTLWQSTEKGAGFTLTHFWQKGGCEPLRRNFPACDNLPWAERMLQQGESFHFSSLDELPAAAARDVEVLRSHGTRSNASFPLTTDGGVIGAITFAMVTTERRWTDDELSSLKLIAGIFGHVISRRRAEERAGQLGAELVRSAKASVLGEIAAALAHEINQPLSAILSNAQAARRFLRQGTADPAEMQAILNDIIRDDKRATEVIQNLRAMLSDAPVSREPHCINELVSQAAEFLKATLKSENIELVIEAAPLLPRLRVARAEIHQILLNLILNAVHAMDETPLEWRRIVIQTSTSGEALTVRVRDHGSGIPQEHMDRIFEPFHTTRANGLGMGLAICRRIAAAHGGVIEASNTEPAGAEFTLTLPLHDRR